MKRSCFLILAMFLAACGGEQHDDVKKWMNEAGKDLRGRIPPLPEVKSFPVAEYEAGNRKFYTEDGFSRFKYLSRCSKGISIPPSRKLFKRCR